MTSFEDAFAQTERAADSVVTAASVVLKAAKAMSRASRDGEVARVKKANQQLSVAAQALRQEISNAQSAWPIDPEREEALFAGSFADELIDMGKREGLTITRQDDRLLAFPFLLKVVPGRRAIQIDKKSVTAVRPSRLVRFLREHEDAKPRSSPEKFIEVLYDAYCHLSDSVAGVPLHRVYSLLTLMPEWRKEYTPADFSRDLYFLDHSGKTLTKSGARMSLPAATGTKTGKVYSFVTPRGDVVTYYGLRFQQ